MFKVLRLDCGKLYEFISDVKSFYELFRKILVTVMGRFKTELLLA
jgi:hypothetical protein